MEKVVEMARRQLSWQRGRWTSRYGSVVVSGSTEPGGAIDAVFDGVNERGLAANLLYLAENDFGLATAPAGRPRLSFAA